MPCLILPEYLIKLWGVFWQLKHRKEKNVLPSESHIKFLVQISVYLSTVRKKKRFLVGEAVFLLLENKS